jgi:phosphate/sulfate permease
MPEFYLVLVILLFILAVSDLVVGVSNDAVNFLNSAIGSKVAPRHIIMIIASLGILAGATFSSGMMEVARKGIFNPQFFFFSEIMIIFLAVMLTDIILLDLFNTFGMPTSTTVSIVFELLGAAVAVSFLKISYAGESFFELGNYINASSAVLIISGIFMSVLIAFVIGGIVQYFSRLLFSFHIESRIKWVGALWSGFALACLTYFLLIKGINGASFITDEFMVYVQENRLALFVGSFVFWTIGMQCLLLFTKVNILRVIVLFGTFALAMAFAGNDLVNFIGVPVAGFESYLAWVDSGQDPTVLSMNILNEPVRTKTYLLLMAGLIMVITLWFSKKARSVTETEVNLGRQDEGSERFEPNAMARYLVRHSLRLGKGVEQFIPKKWMDKAEKNFQPLKIDLTEGEVFDPPAFDLVRASVNLTVASILIAFATSLKLPLSTTYVSFMVAMGTSLSDKAWGRNSAVYRISGVLNVIGGWFFTAAVAFTAAATFASFIYFAGGIAIAILVLLAVVLISRTFILHGRKEKKKQKAKAFEQDTSVILPEGIVQDTSQKVANTIDIVLRAYTDAIEGLLHENRSALAKAEKDIDELIEENELLKQQLFRLIERVQPEHVDMSRIYLLVYDLEQDFLQSASLLVKLCSEYVENSLDPVMPYFKDVLEAMIARMNRYLEEVATIVRKEEFSQINSVLSEKNQFYLYIEEEIAEQVSTIQSEHMGMRMNMLVFSIQLETKDLIAVAARFVKLYKRAEDMGSKGQGSLVVGDDISEI